MAEGETPHRTELRRRVSSFYAAYAPEKLANVEEVIDKHADSPNSLIAALTTKYGPEPPMPAGSPQGYGSEQRQRRLSFAPGTYAGAGHGVSSGSAPEDPDMMMIRRLATDTGFLTQDHERRWEEAWLGKIPLSTVCKEPGDILLEGFGYKHASAQRVFGKWMKRYFVLITPFVYYFEKDDLTSPCRGVIYLPRAEISEAEIDNRTAIEIQSRVLRKPSGKDGAQDYSAFVICFDSDRQQSTWMEVMKRLATVTAKRSTAGQRGGQTVPPDVAAAAAAAAVARMRGTSMGSSAPLQARAAPPAAHQPAAAAAASPTKAELPIKRQEIVSRIRRVVTERDSQQALDIILEFVENQVTDSLQLWRLMEAIEMLEKRPAAQPAASGYYSAPNSGVQHSYSSLSAQPSLVAAPSTDVARAAQLLLSSQSFEPLPPSPLNVTAATPQGQGTAATDDGGGEQSPALMRDSSAFLSANLTQTQLDNFRAAQVELQRQMQEMSALVRQASAVPIAPVQSQHLYPVPSYAMSRTEPAAQGTPNAMMHSYASNSLVITPSTATAHPADLSGSTARHMTSADEGDEYMSPPPPRGSHPHAAATPQRYGGGQSVTPAASMSPYDAPSSPAGGVHMQQRLERMRSRKKALDDMMRDLPQ
jgi:hypothetical protein